MTNWKSLLTITLFCVSIGTLTCKQFTPDIPYPNYQSDFFPVTNKNVGNQKILSITFPDVDYQIQSDFYTLNQHLSVIAENGQGQIYNKSLYDNLGKSYCRYYPSIMNAYLNVSINQQTMPIVYKVTQDKVYLIDKTPKINIYEYNDTSIKQVKQIQIPDKIFQIVADTPTTQIKLLVLSQTVLLFSDLTLWYIKGDKFQEINNITSFARHAGAINQSYFWEYTINDFKIYKLNKNKDTITIQLTKQIKSDIKQLATDIHYDAVNQIFYTLCPNKLYIVNIENQQKNQQYQIQGDECSSISMIKNTMYIACEVDRINFVVELRVNNNGQDIMINRYYDDNNAEGIRKVQSLSYNKIALIGDQVVQVIGQGINRNILLQMLKRDGNQQNNQQFYQYGLLDIYPMLQYSNKNRQVILTINYDTMQIYTIVREPPQIQCNFQRKEVGPSISLLAVFNSTYCNNIESDKVLGGTQSICETFYPFQIAIGERQLQHKTAKIIMLLATLIIGVLSIICIGCGVKIRNGLNQTINRIQKKLMKLKQGDAAIKQI